MTTGVFGAAELFGFSLIRRGLLASKAAVRVKQQSVLVLTAIFIPNIPPYRLLTSAQPLLVGPPAAVAQDEWSLPALLAQALGLSALAVSRLAGIV